MIATSTTLANVMAAKEKALQNSIDTQNKDIENYRKRYNEAVNKRN